MLWTSGLFPFPLPFSLSHPTQVPPPRLYLHRLLLRSYRRLTRCPPSVGQVSQRPQHLRDRPPVLLWGLELVSPVTRDEATSISIYLPKDTFYDFKTLAPVQGQGTYISLDSVPFTEIPLHIRGGVVLPLRAQSAMTTTEVRKQDFELVVAPGGDGKATGKLYVDDGESVSPSSRTEVWMRFGVPRGG